MGGHGGRASSQCGPTWPQARPHLGQVCLRGGGLERVEGGLALLPPSEPPRKGPPPAVAEEGNGVRPWEGPDAGGGGPAKSKAARAGHSNPHQPPGQCEQGSRRCPTQSPPPGGTAPLCNLFVSAHVIVQVWGCSRPRGACHLWAAPTQVLFILLVLFAGGH